MDATLPQSEEQGESSAPLPAPASATSIIESPHLNGSADDNKVEEGASSSSPPPPPPPPLQEPPGPPPPADEPQVVEEVEASLPPPAPEAAVTVTEISPAPLPAPSASSVPLVSTTLGKGKGDDYLWSVNPGRYALGKMWGSPWWPVVLYNRVEEIPSDLRRSFPNSLPRPGPTQVLALFIGEYTWSTLEKKNIRSTDEMSKEVILKECSKKWPMYRTKLKAAMEEMEEMSKAITMTQSSDEDEGHEEQEGAGNGMIGGSLLPPPPPPLGEEMALAGGSRREIGQKQPSGVSTLSAGDSEHPHNADGNPSTKKYRPSSPTRPEVTPTATTSQPQPVIRHALLSAIPDSSTSLSSSSSSSSSSLLSPHARDLKAKAQLRSNGGDDDDDDDLSSLSSLSSEDLGAAPPPQPPASTRGGRKRSRASDSVRGGTGGDFIPIRPSPTVGEVIAGLGAIPTYTIPTTSATPGPPPATAGVTGATVQVLLSLIALENLQTLDENRRAACAKAFAAGSRSDKAFLRAVQALSITPYFRMDLTNVHHQRAALDLILGMYLTGDPSTIITAPIMLPTPTPPPTIPPTTRRSVLL